MNEALVAAVCRRKSFRYCQQLYGISQGRWKAARLSGELPEPGAGRPKNDLLTNTLLDLVRRYPTHSIERYALELGCSNKTVWRRFQKQHLSHLWQRLKYADVELKEVDPELLKARKNHILVDGPGAQIHLDAKRYGALQGGLLLAGTPKGSKTGVQSVSALKHFMQTFPIPVRHVLTDNGSEFVNKDVDSFLNKLDITHKTIIPGHPWSNGKVEVCQRLLKREIVVPLLVESRFDTIPEFQKAFNERVFWFNTQRPHFGHINRGLTPLQVIEATALCNSSDEREDALTSVRRGLKYRNRREWESLNLSKETAK